MGKLVVIIEKTGTGYSAYVPDIPGIATAAETFDELRENVKELLDVYVETAVEYGDPDPDIQKGEYAIEYKFDIQAFMQWMSRVMSQRGLSEIADMNESLISQYASGIKSPGPKQLQRIQKAIHRFADDLHAISF
ncbi:MAG TPA: type II toxin-antitoxin system HicB family antitoxin [Prolixibacteraceae bacterium]|nr:type II toxin-antitoxin system HicB family antitoxin [Prolixibacteraceae bacterium]